MFHSIRQENTVLRKLAVKVAQFLNSPQQGDTPGVRVFRFTKFI